MDEQSTGYDLSIGGNAPPKPNGAVGITPEDLSRVSQELNRFWAVDEAAAVQLIKSCRGIREDATADEIAFFVAEKLYLARESRTITNPTGFIISTVPQCFVGQTFVSFRRRRAESLRMAAEEKARKAQEDEAMKAYFRREAKAVLANPNSSEKRRIEAEDALRIWGEGPEDSLAL
jgi:hypothetical protein